MKERVGLLFAALVLVVGGCSKSSSEDCLGASHQSDPYCAGDAMSNLCTANEQCSGGTAVCEVSVGTCVECLAPDQASSCSGTSPVCGDDHACRACSAHADCASDACLPDGSCAAESAVAYVAAAGSGTACTRAAPCGQLADAVATGRPTAKIAAGTVKAAGVTTLDGKTLTILADPGAKLDRDGDGPILLVESANADISIVGLEISGQTGSFDSAILLTSNGGAPKLSLTRCAVSSNQGTGITANGGSVTLSESTVSSNTGGGITTSGGALTISGSTVTTNNGPGVTSNGGSLTLTRSTISLNGGGGISVGAGTTIDITNNFVFRNGSPDSSNFGGVDLRIAVASTNRFEFNTIVDNRASNNSGGVSCDVTSFVGPNNIIARNSLGGSTTSSNAQTRGACGYGMSKVQTDVATLGFVDPESPAPFDYHLTAASSAVDQASTSTVTVDYDGDPRPMGAASDLGADELAP